MVVFTGFHDHQLSPVRQSQLAVIAVDTLLSDERFDDDCFDHPQA